MPRGYEVYLEDIEGAIRRIKHYTAGLSQEAFSLDEKSVDAVIRNLEVIGEAVKRIPDSTRAAHPRIAWRKIAGLRDILAHQYFDVDIDIVWDVVHNKLPTLEEEIQQMLSK